MTYPMKHGVLKNWGRVSHGWETQDVHEVADLQGRALPGEHTKSLALTLQKESIARLLVANDASHAHAVPRSVPGRKAQQ
ncbi:MAG TPA: hypothetical protein VGH56_04150, partial [Solirubrobacteraceae bacterium]